MKKFSTGLGFLTAAAFVLVGCGSQSADPAPEPAELEAPAEADTAQQDDSPTESDDDAPAGSGDAPAGVTVGTVVVDGTAYELTEVIRCEPYSTDQFDIELELQGLGKLENDERIQLDVSTKSASGISMNDVAWSGPEGIFGGGDDTQFAESADGSTVSGSATLLDAQTLTDSITVEFELEVPTEEFACR